MFIHPFYQEIKCFLLARNPDSSQSNVLSTTVPYHTAVFIHIISKYFLGGQFRPCTILNTVNTVVIMAKFLWRVAGLLFLFFHKEFPNISCHKDFSKNFPTRVNPH